VDDQRPVMLARANSCPPTPASASALRSCSSLALGGNVSCWSRANKIFWKIDYFAPDMESGSADPADPKQTVRVLTIMLASEY
jgi:Protein of unknown function (DUF3768)